MNSVLEDNNKVFNKEKKKIEKMIQVQHYSRTPREDSVQEGHFSQYHFGDLLIRDQEYAHHYLLFDILVVVLANII